MTKQFIVAQSDVTSRHYEQLGVRKNANGVDLHYEYRKLNLSSTSADYIGTAIGVMIFSDVEKFGISPTVVAKYIGGIRNFVLTEIAMDACNWKFDGATEEVADYRRWISDGSEAVRKRNVQKILGISERSIYRYLVIDSDLSVSGESKIKERFRSGDYRLSIVLDAFKYVNNIKKNRPGVLFSISTKKGVS